VNQFILKRELARTRACDCLGMGRTISVNGGVELLLNRSCTENLVIPGN